jgi:hypothetical protein
VVGAAAAVAESDVASGGDVAYLVEVVVVAAVAGAAAGYTGIDVEVAAGHVATVAETRVSHDTEHPDGHAASLPVPPAMDGKTHMIGHYMCRMVPLLELGTTGQREVV